MNINTLISELQTIEKANGNIQVTTNGEHGTSDILVLEQYLLTVGTTELLHADDKPVILNDSETILHIGGY